MELDFDQHASFFGFIRGWIHLYVGEQRQRVQVLKSLSPCPDVKDMAWPKL
jgi:hypothetical protein